MSVSLSSLKQNKEKKKKRFITAAPLRMVGGGGGGSVCGVWKFVIFMLKIIDLGAKFG